ncbi:MAG: FtsX-like permease family protein [Proteobacteria bacterium]|nr:FtsX-like permease family protein [Pseudomonadota bacterium]
MDASPHSNVSAALLLGLRAVLRRLIARPASSLILILGIALSSAALLAVIVASRASIAAFSEAVSGLDSYELRSWSGEYSPNAVAGWLNDSSADFDISPFADAEAEVAGKKLTVVGADMAVVGSEGLERTLFVPKALRATFKDPKVLQAPVQLRIGGREIIFERVTEVTSPAALADSQSLLVDIATLQRVIERPGMVRWLALSPRFEAAVPTSTGLPAGFYLSSASERRSQAEKLLEAFRLNILVMVAMTLAVAAISVLNTLQLHVLGSGVELSTLRVLGVGRLGIFVAVTAEALLLGGLGGALGSTLGRPLARVIAEMFLDTAGALYFGGRELNTASLLDSPYLSLLGFGTAVLISLLGALLPAWQASKVLPALGTKRPATSAPLSMPLTAGGCAVAALLAVFLAKAALNSQSVLLAHGASIAVVLATLAGAALVLSGVVVAMRTLLGRTKVAALLVGASLVASHRKAAALSAMVASVGCALLFGIGIMIGSFRHTLQGWIDHTVAADLFIRVADDTRGLESLSLPEELLGAFAAVDGVSKVTSFARITTTLSGLSVQLGGTDLNWLLDHNVYELISGDCSAEELSAGRAVMISEVAARKLAISAGQTLAVLGKELTVCGVYQDFAAQGGAVLMEREPFSRLAGAYPIFSVGVYLAPLANRKMVRAQIEQLVAGNAVVLDNQGLREQILTTFDRTFSITGLVRMLLFLMSLGGAAIGIAQILFERSQELRTFQILGARSKEIALAVGWLGTEIALCAAVAGTLGGLALSLVLLKVINPVSFGWSLGFAPSVLHFLPPLGALLIGVPIVALLAAAGLSARMKGGHLEDTD